MKLQGVLRRDRLDSGELAIYEKGWRALAYIVLEDAVVEVKHGCRVPVPMSEDDGKSDEKILGLIRTAAELGDWVDYEGDFSVVQRYFRSKDLPLGAVLKNPELAVQPPSDVLVFNHASAPKDRFYCLTTPENLGVIPFTPGFIVTNVQHPESLGFALHEPRGVLTVFI